MSIQIDDSLRVGQQKNIDAKYDNDGNGWTSVAQVMGVGGVTLGERSHGQHILINDVVYWWHPSNPLTSNPIIKDNPANTVDDGLISGGSIDIGAFGSGNITVDTASWILTVSSVQQVYATASPTLFTGIGLSTSGNQRYVAFYGTDVNTIIKVEGAQSPAAVMPSTPPNTVLLGYVLVTAAQAEPPVIDLSGVAKLNQDNIFTEENEFTKTPTVNGVNVATVNDVPTVPKASVADINTGTDNDNFITSLGLQGSKYLDRAFAKISATTTGTSTAYVASLTPALTGYVTNQPLLLTFNVASGASPTVNVNTLGTRNLLRMDGTAIQANDLLTNVRYIFYYDGTAFRLATPLYTELIRNQNASQQSANFWALIGRLDTGLGLGIAANAAAFETIAAATAAKAQMLLTQGTVDVTATTNGLFWNNGGEIKFIDTTIVNRILKIYNNELLKSDGNYSVSVNQYGDISAVNKEIEQYVFDTDIITAITTATYTFDKSTISVSGKTLYSGQIYFDSSTNIYYEAIDDNVVLRTRHNTTGGASYTHSGYTVGSPLVVTQGTTADLANNGSTIVGDLPFGVTTFINTSNGKVVANTNNDNLLITLSMKFKSSNANGKISVNLNIGGAFGVIRTISKRLDFGVGVEQSETLTFDVYTGSTFISNGGVLQVSSITGDTSVYDYNVKVTRISKGG